MSLNNRLPQIYISGALSANENVERLKKFYEAIGDICEIFELQPYIPHLHTDPEKHPDVDPEEVWKIDKEKVLSSGLVISYIGTPSLGVGMELAYAEDHNIPIIVMYETNRRVSRMARGLPKRVKIAEIAFENYDSGLDQLRQVLDNWTSSKKHSGESTLHIREEVKSNNLLSHISITDEAGIILLNLDLPETHQMDFIKSKFISLKQKGIMPSKLYIQPWSEVNFILSQVWPNAKLLQEYQD